MKLIAVGDTHGRRLWKQILEKEQDFDKWIFIGDYFDSRESITADVQMANFKEILEFKQSNPDKVVLLLGNHDFHYLKGANEDYSNYQFARASEINALLQPAIDAGLIQMCYVHEKLIFTHAGLTKTWVHNNKINLGDLENSINLKFLTDLTAFRFTMGYNMDNSGNDVTQGPTWVRIPSLMRDMLDGYTFVVGHSTLKELTHIGNIIGIDTLGTSQEYLKIENNHIKIGKINLEY